MEDNTKASNVTINISGGINQVLPNATQAIQVISGDQYAAQKVHQAPDTSQPSEPAVQTPLSEAPHAPEMSDDAISLLRYIGSEERLNGYLKELQRCRTATELAQVIVQMYHAEKDLLDFEIKKERFIKIIRNLAPEVKTGNTVSNIRARVKEQLNLIGQR